MGGGEGVKGGGEGGGLTPAFHHGLADAGAKHTAAVVSAERNDGDPSEHDLVDKHIHQSEEDRVTA